MPQAPDERCGIDNDGVGPANRDGRAGEESGPKVVHGMAREAGSDAPDGSQEVGIGTPCLTAPPRIFFARTAVRATSQGVAILHFDRVPTQRTSTFADTLRPPERGERVSGDGDAGLLVDPVDRGRRRQTGRNCGLKEQPKDVSLSAGDLLADNDRAPARCVLSRYACAIDAVVVRDGDGGKPELIGPLHHLSRRRATVAERGVSVQVRKRESSQGCIFRWMAGPRLTIHRSRGAADLEPPARAIIESHA